jgi:hypothetical protein
MTIRLALMEAQMEQIRSATGREVHVLELRLQGWPEPAAAQEDAAELEFPACPDKEPAPEPAAWHSASRPRRSVRGVIPR